MPIDNFNGLNSNSKEIGFVVHTDEILERGNQIFFTKSRVLAVLSEFFDQSESSEIQLELQRVYKDEETGEVLYDDPIIVGDFPSLEEDLADGSYIITAKLKRVPITKLEPGEVNTVLVTDSNGKVVWRESENFRVVRPDEILKGSPNSIMVTNNDEAVEWLRFDSPNSIVIIDEEMKLKIINSNEDNSVLVMKDGKLFFDKNYQPDLLGIDKLEVGVKNSVLVTGSDKKTKWSPINELLNIMDNTKKLDYIRSLVPFYAQVYRLYDFHIDTFSNPEIIENSVNILRNEVDGVMTFNTTVGNALLETRTISMTKQFTKIFFSSAPSYDFINIFYSLNDGIDWTLFNKAPIEFLSPRDTIKLKFVVNKSDTTPVELDFYGFLAVFTLGD